VTFVVPVPPIVPRLTCRFLTEVSMLLALSLAAAAVASIPPRPVVPADVYFFRAVSSLEVSPDGKTLVYGIERADEKEDTFRYELWSMDSGGGKARRLCDEESSCTRPRFSPDGSKLAWLESNGEATQIVVARAGSRKGRAVTRGAEDVGDYDWSPDGDSLVFTRGDPYVFHPAPGAPQPAGGSKPDRDTVPFVITRTQIQRDGEGFLDNRNTHLYVVAARGGEARRITSGAYDDDSPRWSPRGVLIAFVSNRNATDPDATDDTDIYVVSPQGGAPRKLAGNPGPDVAPSWSRSGDRLAFVGSLRPNDYYQITRAMVVPVSGGTPTDLTGALDQWVASDNVVTGSGALRLIWSADDGELLVPLARGGASWLAAIPASGGPAKEILGGAEHQGLVRLAATTRRLFYTRSTPGVVTDLWTAAADGTGARKLFGPNDDAMTQLRLSAPAKLVARSGGVSVDAWLYPPLGLDPAKKYPMVVYVHGGPQEYDGEYFDTGLENQIFPGKGWAVLRVNYRGSTSYGEAFSRALWADWHDREFDDLMAAVDAAIAENPWIDAERLGIGGWSYGGIMTVWTVGHTKRFRVGVPERFEVDYLSCFGTDQWFVQYLTEMGSPLENAEKYRAKSPATYVPDIATPLYLIANEEDANCPPTQAMQLYQRLKLRGVPTELVIYPDENHSMSEPSHYVDRLYRLVNWFGRHLK
jgi:dipeptidyl aminopeptidase/acylaminoacyl peptidase